ncbi:MAG: hypothetical protein AB1349_03110 [Elusimicrobiota bacterium]
MNKETTKLQNRDEVGLETNISSGRVDYSFKISGIVKFFVEAKPLKANLQKPDYAAQAIRFTIFGVRR